MRGTTKSDAAPASYTSEAKSCGTLGPWDSGTMGLWDNGTLGMAGPFAVSGFLILNLNRDLNWTFAIR